MSFDIAKIRSDFPLLARQVRGKPIVYLDGAATNLKPRPMIDAVMEHYEQESANIHRAVHYLSEVATQKYEDVRSKVAKFINARDHAQIVFTSGTTAAINLVAYSYGRKFLGAGDEILITHMEHHANIVPWQQLCAEKGCVLKVAPINDAGEIDMEAFYSLLSKKTKLVSVVYVSNSLGTINPVKDIIAAAHGFNIPVLVDAAQAAPHMKLDVQDLDCDFLAFSGHKLFGPTGVGVLYGKRDLLERMPPFLSGGDMIRSVTFAKTEFAPVPQKFEAGTPHIAGVIGMGAAIDYVSALGLANITAYEQTLLEYATKRLSAIPGLRIIGTAEHKAAIVSFVLDDVHPHDIGSIVDSEGVAIRTGHHCCQPVMERYGVPATARASLTFYNTIEDIDVLVKAIGKAKEMFA